MANADPIHTLEILTTKVGTPQPGMLDALIASTNNTELTAKGSEVATSRVVTDGVRLYQEAHNFWSTASDAQKQTVKGFSYALLIVAVHHLLALHKQKQTNVDYSTAEGQSKARRSSDAVKTATLALLLRDQAWSALRDAAGLDEGLRAEVGEAVGTADNAESLARGLDQLASVLNRWLNAPADSALHARLMLANLDAQYAQDLTTSAAAVRATAAQAGERVEAKAAAQSALDREDGIAILLLGQIIRAFDAAHDIDPTIPRLVPNSTRRLFSRRAKRTSSAATPPNT